MPIMGVSTEQREDEMQCDVCEATIWEDAPAFRVADVWGSRRYWCALCLREHLSELPESEGSDQRREREREKTSKSLRAMSERQAQKRNDRLLFEMWKERQQKAREATP